MQISNAGLALIKRFEGCSLSVYRCAAGYWTIGYGHLCDAAQLPITQAQAEQWLRDDVRMAEAAVRRLIAVPLLQGQFDALVSFTFNLGAGALERSTLRRMVNRGEHAQVPAEFARWVYANGRKLTGLLRRRREEARLYAGFLTS